MAKNLSPSRLSSWYEGLAQALEAGLGLPEALELCAGPPPTDRLRMAAALRSGADLDTVLAAAPGWIPPTDRLLWSAGAAGGRGAEMLRRLAEEQAELGAQRQALLLATLYPLFVLGFALLLVPLPFLIEFNEAEMVTFDGSGYLPLLGRVLGGFALFLLTGKLLARRAPRIMERLARLVPGLRGFWAARGVARFAWTLDALFEAGVRATEAIGGGALAVGDTRLTPAVLGQLDRIARGEALGPLLPAMGVFPPTFCQQYQTAETTGQLHHTLPALAAQYRAIASHKLKLVAFWYPKLLFLLVALGIGLSLAQVYGQYLHFVLSLAE